MKQPGHSIRPLLLPPNYVWRSYRGGRELRRFRDGASGPDDHFPEDWLASTVRALNGANSQGPDEGLSRIRMGLHEQFLADALAEQPEFWFGPSSRREHLGVLWKLLDAAERLQLQAHPNETFARRFLNSSAGKTECWYVLATRGPAEVYLGFQRSPGREHWARLIQAQHLGAMLACFDPIPVQPGDCFVVPAGTPHAIGAGIFMLELQEPTDWVVRCEMRTTDGAPLPPEACFMGLNLETCLDVFDYTALSVTEVRDRWQQRPRPIQWEAGFREEEIIDRRWHRFFRLHRLRGHGAAAWPGGELMLAVIVRGVGRLRVGRHVEPAHAGQTWLLPGCAHEWQWLHPTGEWEILLAKLPLHTVGQPVTPATRCEPC
ncbi:MAG: class I mannose-6-phosphate isomerase [Verrucomicrobiales bacterium]|nr:class I mannose-6-phosphate isomerase [Verrucomicrobiales bacterium]